MAMANCIGWLFDVSIQSDQATKRSLYLETLIIRLSTYYLEMNLMDYIYFKFYLGNKI